MALDEQLNDYFVRGMEQAIIREEKAGYIIPPYDDEIYAVKEESKSREVTEEDITDDDHEDNDDDHDEDTANEDERPVQEMAVDNRAPHVEEDKRQSGISLLVIRLPELTCFTADNTRNPSLTMPEAATQGSVRT